MVLYPVAAAYMPADAIAVRIIRAIRTVVAFGTMDKEVDRYA
jgi:hypothetical protein